MTKRRFNLTHPDWLTVQFEDLDRYNAQSKLSLPLVVQTFFNPVNE
jgi:hypothetical protein